MLDVLQFVFVIPCTSWMLLMSLVMFYSMNYVGYLVYGSESYSDRYCGNKTHIECWERFM